MSDAFARTGPLRLFSAEEISEEVRSEAAGIVARLGEKNADVKWAAKENMHITLKFLGRTMPEEAEKLKKALAEVAGVTRAFRVRLSKLGAFPPGGSARVIWLGVEEGERELKALSEEVEDKLSFLGFSKEERPFSAHLTLGRVRSGKNLGPLVRLMKETTFRSKELFLAEALTLYKSELSPLGPRYEVIRRFGFRHEQTDVKERKSDEG